MVRCSGLVVLNIDIERCGMKKWTWSWILCILATGFSLFMGSVVEAIIFMGLGYTIRKSEEGGGV